MAVTATLLTALKERLVSAVDHAQFKIGSTYTAAPIAEKRVNADGTVTIGFYIEASSGTVTQCRLLDAQNAVLASRNESIVLQAGEPVYYFFTYSVYELTT